MNVLVLCDDYWHPARVPRQGLSTFQDREFDFDWIEDARGWSAERMASYPLVILTKSNNISSSDLGGWMMDQVQSAFVDFVCRGNGLLAIHSGTAEYQDMPMLRNLLVGVFTHHPEQCPVALEMQIDHAITTGADDPDYHSPEYEAQKQREAEGMIDQIEKHMPGFRGHIHSLIIGTPTTIERYLLKNGGAVGGPKNQIGQEMLKRLHARSEWKNLYFCGDSTVMGTGAPAATVSGVGAANVILRELHLPEYEPRKFSTNHVHFVDIPYQRPEYSPADPITGENAHLAAANCQGCQQPDCVEDCPAGIDIPGFLRRMEAKNYAGAARLIREKNPFGEVWGLTCAANQLCQCRCYRRDFTGMPVRI